MGLVGLDPIDLVLGDAVGIVDEAARVRQRQHFAAQLDDLFGGMRRDIARSRDYRRLAVQVKTDLTEQLYEQDFERDSNVIEVFIGRLRRKLDPEDQLQPIETLRGRGYRFALARNSS